MLNPSAKAHKTLLCSGLCSWIEKILLTPVASAASQASLLFVQMCGTSGRIGEGRKQW